MLAVDYRALPQATWEGVAPFIGLELSAADIARMRGEACFDSKSAARHPFIAKPAAAAVASEALRAQIAQILEPLCCEFARRHSGAA